jgi:antitoxin component of MazEF toxin-antitoxin module
MSRVIVRKWGRNLAIRVPVDVARASGLSDGEEVEIEARGGAVLIRRDADRARARSDAEAAAAEIIRESKSHSLNSVAIREFLEAGRRG